MVDDHLALYRRLLAPVVGSALVVGRGGDATAWAAGQALA
jgi:hypothetical protein